MSLQSYEPHGCRPPLMAAYLVKYKVRRFGEEYLAAGPYDSETEAYEHLSDISGYEGVHSAHVTEAPAPTRFQLLDLGDE